MFDWLVAASVATDDSIRLGGGAYSTGPSLLRTRSPFCLFSMNPCAFLVLRGIGGPNELPIRLDYFLLSLSLHIF